MTIDMARIRDGVRVACAAGLVLAACVAAHAEPEAIPTTASGQLPTADGFRGIWYANQPSNDEYVYKYSGGLATYPQQHTPIAIYAAAVDRTFFVYGGRYANRNRLLHMISCFDHKTKKLARPRILLDKQTDDAHDNPVLSIDGDGFIWVFSNAHGTSRPAYIHRSRKPYDVTSFDLVQKTNFSYGQPWWMGERGFVFLHTRYIGGNRVLHVARSKHGREWSQPERLSWFGKGHYQVSQGRGDRLATAFNYHPAKVGLNARTNLYYVETRDGGESWQSVTGRRLKIPLDDPDNLARVIELESRRKLVYLKDLAFTRDGHPVILYMTSRGYESGPKNGPRVLAVAAWRGDRWSHHPVAEGDNNYDFASIYIESDQDWRVIGSLGPGPQPFNPGGEIRMIVSHDAGRSWAKPQDLTRDSRFNHTYPRRPVDAHPDFYAIWADGHGRKPSESRLYFATREGEVYRMPQAIEGDAEWVSPEPMR